MQLKHPQFLTKREAEEASPNVSKVKDMKALGGFSMVKPDHWDCLGNLWKYKVDVLCRLASWRKGPALSTCRHVIRPDDVGGSCKLWFFFSCRQKKTPKEKRKNASTVLHAPLPPLKKPIQCKHTWLNTMALLHYCYTPSVLGYDGMA